MLTLSAPLTKPGLFITGTDTGVGKTVVTCGILAALREQAAGQRLRLGPCKPFATGCREGRDGPIQEDVQALLRFSETKAQAATVCPQAFRQPAAPAVAAEAEGREVKWESVAEALQKLDQTHDALLIEGVGGALVPLDPRQPRYTVRDLIRAIGYPALVVCRAELGTLNHTVMTVEALERSGCRVIGLVMNHTVPGLREADDPTIATNALWLERMTGIKVLCRIPYGRDSAMQLEHGRMDPAVQNAIASCHWGDLFAAADGK
ncbi:MAG: dethiobiotin synthase [Planctomycetota bacterium]